MTNKTDGFGSPFLTAQWSYLAMLNYEIDPALLLPLVPKGTELDTWNGTTFASMVGFLFLDTRVLGMAVPFHRDFEEIDLRFYVRCKAGDGWRRGIVFVTKIVPRLAIALAVRRLYNENYLALSTGNVILRSEVKPANIESVKYYWTFRGRTDFLAMETRGEPYHFTADSQEEFISQHYWGYSSQRDGGTIEYRVEHPAWRIWQAASCRFDCDVDSLYGKPFAKPLSKPPVSGFLAEGAPVTVYKGRRVG